MRTRLALRPRDPPRRRARRRDLTVIAFRLALRNLVRDLKSGEIAVLLLALMVAVASLTAVGLLHQPRRPCREPAGGRGARGGPAPRVGAYDRRSLRPRGSAPRAARRADPLDAERRLPRRGFVADRAARRERGLSAARAPQGRGSCRSGRLEIAEGIPAPRRGLGRFAAAREPRRDGRVGVVTWAPRRSASRACSTIGRTRALASPISRRRC